MTVVMPILGVLALGIFMAVAVGRSWDEGDADRRRNLRLAEIERERQELFAERTLIMARDAGLITYDETAAWLPRHITTEIEETRP